MIRSISRQELKIKMDRHDDFVLLETLPESAYRWAHLPGARNAPPDKLGTLMPQLVPDKNKPIVLYCASPT